jgi:hypothetical protein
MLLSVVLLTICVAAPFSALAGAKGRRTKTFSRSRKQIGASHFQDSRRSISRHRGRHASRFAEDEPAAAVPSSYPIAPDRIEVIESGTTPSPELARFLNPLPPRVQPAQDASDSDLSVSARRKGLSIDQSRVLQIQQALNQHGFYFGEMTGVYDDATVDAMRRFQTSEKIPATGFPTAHALKRLGLASW